MKSNTRKDLINTIKARKKNNLLICEGYMDVISLHQNGIQSVVAPLGTALTEEQLVLSWNFSSKPTIMFDGDKAGLRASFKTSLMSLPLLNSKRFLQFIILDEDYDPDSYINKFSIDNFVNILRKPIPLVNFIFEQSSKTLKLKSADEKIIFDKYLDEIITSIKDDNGTSYTGHASMIVNLGDSGFTFSANTKYWVVWYSESGRCGDGSYGADSGSWPFSTHKYSTDGSTWSDWSRSKKTRITIVGK